MAWVDDRQSRGVDLLSRIRIVERTGSTNADLIADESAIEGDWLVAEVGGLSYPVREGIPVMLIEEAKLPSGVTSLDDFKREFGQGA